MATASPLASANSVQTWLAAVMKDDEDEPGTSPRIHRPEILSPRDQSVFEAIVFNNWPWPRSRPRPPGLGLDLGLVLLAWPPHGSVLALVLDRIPTISCKFLTDKIMNAKNFNYAPKFSQNRSFQTQILHFWTENFRRNRFSDNFPTAQ